MQLSAFKLPTTEMSLTNRAFINSREYSEPLRYSTMHTGFASYIVRVDPSDRIPPGKIGFGLTQVCIFPFLYTFYSERMGKYFT